MAKLKRTAIKLNKIYCENHLITMGNMPDNFIDLVVTSPPYDNLRDYNKYDFDFEKCANELFRVVKNGGVVVWIVGDETINGDETGTSFKQALYFKKIGFKLFDTMIFKKDELSFPNHNRYQTCFEYMFILSKNKPKCINLIRDKINKSFGEKHNCVWERQKNGKIIKKRKEYRVKEFGLRLNIWEYNTGYMNSSKDEIAFMHPAIFPEALARDHILSWSNPGCIVYDPMMGSGTVAKQAALNNRYYIGSEISEEYVKQANLRLSVIPKYKGERK